LARISATVVDRVLACVDAELLVLFGSAVHGRARPDSDLDLLVVAACGANSREVTRELSRQLGTVAMPVDLHVVPPAASRAPRSKPSSSGPSCSTGGSSTGGTGPGTSWRQHRKSAADTRPAMLFQNSEVFL